MNLIDSSESALKATMDKHAFQLNVCVQDQSREGCYDTFINSLGEYGQAAMRLDVLQKIKSQLPAQPPQQPEANDEG